MSCHALCFSNPDRSRKSALLWSLLALLVVLPACKQEDAAASDTAGDVVPVERGPLRISVKEGGDLESGDPVEVRSEVEGRNAIIALAAEGSYVKKGAEVVRLDSAQLEEKLNRQEIAVDKARTQLASATESLAIQKKSNQEQMKDAETKKLLAERALKGYLLGTFPLDEQTLRSDLTLAKETHTRATADSEASERLFKKEIISRTELDADLLALKQAEERVEIAKAKLENLLKWTSKDEIKRLESDLAVKSLAVERVTQQTASELAQSKDSLVNAQRNFDLEEEQVEKLRAQLTKCVLFAPADGLVVYAKRGGGRHSREEPVALGTEIREREAIIRLPNLSNMMVLVEIHESSIKKVKRGQGAWIKVDALPGRVFPGKVSSVALVPSSQSSWMNPDLKVYETEVRLDTGLTEEELEGLKPGMHAQVEILVEEIANALQLPLSAVAQAGSKAFVYVKKGNEVELREVDVGLNNESNVHIKSGLDAGELVYLAPPSGAPALPEPEEDAFLPATSAGTGAPMDGQAPGAGAARPFDDGNMPGRAARPTGEGRRGGRGARGGGEGRRGREGGRGGQGGRRGGGMTEEQRAKWAGMSAEERAEFIKKMREGRGGGGNRGERGGENRNR